MKAKLMKIFSVIMIVIVVVGGYWLFHRHEVSTDNAVIEAGIEAQKYQLLLVKKAVGERRFTSVVNGFNQSKIKNRRLL